MTYIKQTIMLCLLCMIGMMTYAEEIPNDEIWYTSSDGNPISPKISNEFGATIISNTYSNGKGVIKFDNSVTTIGSHAFSGCSSLTSITIPNSVTSIGSYAFSGCSSLTSITIPDSVTSIGDWAFSGCSGLTSITIPNSVTSIGEDAFIYCSGLISITIPNSVTSIGSYAFEYCSSLTSITIPNSVTSIGWYTFSYCTGLTSITIPNSVESIGDDAFIYCSGLTSITIPNSVTSIGWNAFSDCTGLTSITIPNSVESIGEGAFGGCYFQKDKFINNSKCSSSNNWGANLCDERTTDGLCLLNNEVIKCVDKSASVVIPNYVTSIGDYAFDGCSSLTSITIPNSVTSIGDWAFSDCTGLTSITIPNSVTSIGGYAFYDCTGLTSITIPNSVESIVDYAFRGCYFQKDKFINNSKCPSSYNWGAKLCDERTTDGLCLLNNEVIKCVGKSASVVIPNYVTSIGSSAFYRCTGLTSITIPNSVTSIGGYAFYDCTGLTSIEIPNSVTNIGYSAFEYCSGLTSVTIPNSVTSIGSSAFYRCTGLTSITIPNSVTNIGSSAFERCSALKTMFIYWPSSKEPSTNFSNVSSCTLYVPRNTESYYRGKSPWSNFGNIVEMKTATSLTLDKTDASLNIGDKIKLTATIMPEDTENKEIEWISSDESVASVVDGVVTCHEYGQVLITARMAEGGYLPTACHITVGYDDEDIPNDEIWYLSKDGKTITPQSLTAFGATIQSNTYTNGKGIIKFNSDVTKIGKQVFYDCSGFLRIVIPNSVTSIEDQAFYGCSNLTSITIPNSVISIGFAAFMDCSGLNSIAIPNSVTSIGERAFNGCSSLADITVKSGNTKYNSRNSCNALIETATNTLIAGCKNTIIPNFVTSIGDGAFYGCSGLISITIPNSVTSIGSSAFYRCTGLTSITIPNSVTSIGDYAFFRCSGLTSIAIPNSVTSIGDYAFSCCSGLTSITIPNSVTSIGGYAFYDCSGLTSITIPNSVTSIGDYAFRECSGLTSITIPNSVTSIGGYAFMGCSGLTSIYVSWKEPLYLSTFLFSNIDYSKCVLYVPVGTSSLYASANVWKEFQHIVEFEPKYNMFAADNNGNDINKVINSGDDVTINDTYQSLSVTEDIDNVNVSYSRTYKNTSWQAWYVPFGFTLTSDIASRFSFAKFAGTYTEAGQFFITLVEMQEGDEIKGNVPYFVQAKVADSSNPQVLNISNTTLYATDASGFKMLSAEKEIAIYGTYAKKVAAADDDWYAYGGGKYIKATTGQSLGAFRFYLTIRDREDNPYASTPNPIEIKVVVLGDEADGISGLNDDPSTGSGQAHNGTMFNLAGQPVGAGYKGVVIRNGKKVFVH